MHFSAHFMHCSALCLVQSHWLWWSHRTKYWTVEIRASDADTETCNTVNHESAWRHGMCPDRLKTSVLGGTTSASTCVIFVNIVQLQSQRQKPL